MAVRDALPKYDVNVVVKSRLRLESVLEDLDLVLMDSLLLLRDSDLNADLNLLKASPHMSVYFLVLAGHCPMSILVAVAGSCVCPEIQNRPASFYVYWRHAAIATTLKRI